MNSGNREEREELLQELLRQQTRALRLTRLALVVCMGVMAAVCVSLYSLYPAVMGAVRHVENSMAGFDTMVENVNTLVEENGEAVTEAVGKLKEVDITGLNEAIGQLADAAGPLSRLGNLFGGFGG